MADHPELVSGKKYTEDFKKVILDFYNYEFLFNTSNEYKLKKLAKEKKKIISAEEYQIIRISKNYETEKNNKKCKTQNNRMKGILKRYKKDTKYNAQRYRISKILKNYVSWDDKKEKNENKIRFINKASEAMKDNPFQRFYRFCRYIPTSDPTYFMHIIAALSWQFELNDKVILYYNDYLTDVAEELGILKNEKFIKHNNLINKKEAANAKREIGALLSDEKDKNTLFEALKKHFQAAFLAENYLFGNTRTTMNRLKYIGETGVIVGKDRPRNKAKNLDRSFYYWCLADTTIEQLIEAGRKINNGFEQHLHSVLDFFSRYYAFGEVGVFLLDRMGEKYNSPFRFRHEYFMQSLCDFHMIDLLDAIEQRKWCLIKYHHATAGFDTELLCYPLQIRIGNRNGREHLMFYDPLRHCYSALRIEFIIGITYYDEDAVIIALSGENDKETIQQEIENSREGLKYLWGVSAPFLPKIGSENNACTSAEPKHITMQIKWDPEKEYYIRNRLYRECRHGTVTELPEKGLLRFDIDVASPSELIPWIRSFYTRIVKLEGFENGSFTLENDLPKMQQILTGSELVHEAPVSPKVPWSVPKEILNRLGNGKEAVCHNLIFNEIFSIYYYIFADMFTNLTADIDKYSKTNFEKAIDSTRKKAIMKYYNRVGAYVENSDEENSKPNKLIDEVMEIFFNNNFFVKKQKNDILIYSPAYKTDGRLDFYKQVLPLSIIEKRWLMTIIKDPKIYLFLNEEEVTFLDELLSKDESRPEPLPMEHIVCYDRYHTAKKKTNENRRSEETEINKKQQHIMSAILEGISSQRSISITYRNNYGKLITGDFDPAVIEYSKRNNSLQGYFLKHGRDNKPFMIFNFSQIIKISVADSKFDHAAAEAKYDKMIEEDTDTVKFEFIDERNLADRLLTEFSPWKRECIRDGDHYTVTLYYRRGIGTDRGEERDIVIRLMSFGGYLRFVDMKKGSIGHQIKERVDSQLQLLQEKSIIKDDGDSR